MAVPSPRPPASIKGNTLRVYLYLMRSGESELRDVQKALGLTTPSLASYHLGKLIGEGYVQQNAYGKYRVVKDFTQEILQGYVKLGTRVVPQLFFTAILFSFVVGFFALMSLYFAEYVPFLVGGSFLLIAVLWYEAIRVWRRLASWK
jgi:hypothetical protein